VLKRRPSCEPLPYDWGLLTENHRKWIFSDDVRVGEIYAETKKRNTNSARYKILAKPLKNVRQFGLRCLLNWAKYDEASSWLWSGQCVLFVTVGLAFAVNSCLKFFRASPVGLPERFLIFLLAWALVLPQTAPAFFSLILR